MSELLLIVSFFGVLFLTFLANDSINGAISDMRPGFRWKWTGDVTITAFIIGWPVTVPMFLIVFGMGKKQ